MPFICLVKSKSLNRLHVRLLGPKDAFGRCILSDDDDIGNSMYNVVASTFCNIHCITFDCIKEALALYPEEYEKLRTGLRLTIDLTKEVKILIRILRTVKKLLTCSFHHL